MTTSVIRYTTRPEAAEQNQKLVEQVYAELAESRPEGLRYATFRLADGVSFVHIATVSGDDNPLEDSAAFAEFQREAGDRVIAPPVVSKATLVGSYEVFEA
jgi:hypothetical protein